jgi:uncharacterized surface protein with fasciclin (FAS1) repeats
MKNTFKIFGLCLLVLASFSCSDDEDTPIPAPKTITAIASSTAEFSSLVAALKKADLDKTLDEAGTFTVFAPTNTAFASFLEEKGFANLEAVPTEVLKEILLNHVLATEVFSSTIKAGYVKTLAKGAATADNTLSMYLNTTSDFKINGVATVTQADIDASNGVIHKVDKVIDLPTIITHATANPDFSSLVAALTREGRLTNFATLLSGTELHTVFAPTNTAFTNYETEIKATVASIQLSVLNRVLRYHIIEGNVLSTGLPASGTKINTLAGSTNNTSFTFLSPPARIKDSSDRESTIDATDVQCSNGVIHVLGKVLIPKSLRLEVVPAP